MRLGKIQRLLVEWALDPMADHWCTEDGADGRDGMVYAETDLPRLQGLDLLLSPVLEINDDLIYRLGTQYPDISNDSRCDAAAGRLADKITQALYPKDSETEPAPEPTAEHVPVSDSETWTYNDGGRHEAGYKGDAGDCLCRAVAIVTGRGYAEVYDEINAACKGEYRTKGRRSPSCARTGIYKPTAKKYLRGLGMIWTATMGIGTGCKVHLKADELPKGRLIATVSKHWVAVINGIIQDTHDSTREGTRCVYGYWMQKNSD